MMRTSDSTLSPRPCELCGKTFIPQQPHHRTCPECFHGQRGGRGGRGEESRLAPTPAALPNDYLANGYFADAKRGVMFPELLTTSAECIAAAMAAADMSMAQIRRYFTMSRSLEDRLKSGEAYDVVANKLRQMKANVAAVVGRVQENRQREQLTRTLKEFIDRNVDAAVQSEQAFRKGFLPHFECVLAYFYWHNSHKGGGRRGA